ncbi:MAG: CPBP family glutamic-type intramembrane protease [Planctomycetota bacterium]
MDLKGFFVFFLALCAFLICQIVTVKLFGRLWGGTVAQVLCFAILPVFLLYTFDVRPLPFPLGLPPRRFRFFCILLVPIFLLFFIQYEMFQEAYLYRSDEALKQMYKENFNLGTASSPLILLSIAVVPAFCEELLFRGLLLESLRPRLGAPLAVGVSSILFALVHPHPLLILPIFLLGLLLGALTVAARTLWPAMAVHFLNNLLVITFFLRPELERAATPFLALRFEVFALSLAAIIVFLGIGWARQKAGKKGAGG